MSKYTKLLPSGWYYATVSQARIEEQKGATFLILAFTINSGEYAWRHILERYPLNKEGMEKLIEDMAEINYIPFIDHEEEYFLKQFKDNPITCSIKVDRYVSQKDSAVKNIIIERKIDGSEPEFDVTKEPSEEHFYKNNKGRGLPI